MLVSLVTSPRDGSTGAASIGAASLGARRDAPVPMQAPSVRSDERPLATQGDMLNSIKFQRRLRESLHSDKHACVFGNANKASVSTKNCEKGIIKSVNSRTSTGTRQTMNQEFSVARLPTGSRNMFGPARPASPKGRRSPHSPSFY